MNDQSSNRQGQGPLPFNPVITPLQADLLRFLLTGEGRMRWNETTKPTRRTVEELLNATPR